MTVNLNTYKIIFTARGIGSVSVLPDATAAQVGSGYGGWQVVSRQRRIGLTTWQGMDPLRMSIPILFDGVIGSTSQEIPISMLSRMGLPPLSGGEPPTLTVKGITVPRPGPVTWTIESLNWGTNVIIDTASNGVTARLRQDCVVNLLQYVADDRVSFKGLQPNSKTTKTGTSQVGWPKTYFVANGDTLKTIAKHFYGDASKWKIIGDANGIRDPKSVQPSTEIRIPAP